MPQGITAETAPLVSDEHELRAITIMTTICGEPKKAMENGYATLQWTYEGESIYDPETRTLLSDTDLLVILRDPGTGRRDTHFKRVKALELSHRPNWKVETLPLNANAGKKP